MSYIPPHQGTYMIGNTTEFIAYAARRGVIIDPDLAEIYLLKASDFINVRTWIGEPENPEQEDAWPRVWYSPHGVKYTGTPAKVITTVYMLAMEVANGVDLMPVTRGGPQVSQASVAGAVSVTYAAGSIGAAPDFPWLTGMIGPWVGGGSIGNFDVSRG